MRVLVIGGTGFIGINLVQALQRAGHEVTCTRRRSSNTLFVRSFKPKWIDADLKNPTSLKEAARGQDAIFFAAGHYPRYSQNRQAQVDEAVSGISHVMTAARLAQVPRVIYTSSITTQLQGSSRSVYFAVKSAMEEKFFSSLSTDLEGTVLCPSACFGPFDFKMGTGGLLVGAIRGSLPYYVDGNFNIIDVEDVARAHVAALESPRPAKRYLLSHHDLRVSEFLQILVARYSAKMPRRIPMAVGYPWGVISEHLHAQKKSRTPIPVEFLDMLKAKKSKPIQTSTAPVHWTLPAESLCEIKTPLIETLDKSYHWYRKYKFL